MTGTPPLEPDPGPSSERPAEPVPGPSSGGTPEAGGSGGADGGGRSAFSWRVDQRPDVRFGHAAGGVAGILLAAAVVGFVVEVTDDDPTLPGVFFNLALIAAALFAGTRVRGPARSAGVAAIAIAVPLVWLFAIVGGGSGPERGDFRLIMLLTIACYAVLYVIGWTRGRAVFLGLAVLVAAGWLVFEVADQATPFGFDVAAQVQRHGLDDPGRALGGVGRDDSTTQTALTEILIAAVLLGGATALDRRGRAGAATPLLLVGSLYAIGGSMTLGIDVDNGYAAGVFIAIAGLAIGLVGTLGQRRATSWLGAATLLAGALVVIAKATDDVVSGGDGAAAAFGAFALLGAAALLAIGSTVARSFDEPVDGGEPLPTSAPAPADPPGASPVGG